jgi:predicted nucleic acid-binding protein
MSLGKSEMAGSRSRRLIAWDSCLFLGWFNQENDKPLEDMSLVLRQVGDGDLAMLVSTICIAEVLDETGVSIAGTEMVQFVKRSNVVPASVDIRVAQLAAKFRQRARAAKAEGRVSQGIKAPDAIIAATAVIYRASVLYSFDPVLIEYSGTDIIDRLVVSDDLSTSGQRRLFQ